MESAADSGSCTSPGVQLHDPAGTQRLTRNACIQGRAGSDRFCLMP